MRSQTTLRLAPTELELLDEAARRLHLDRASLIRAAALGVAELVLAAAAPLLLAVEPASALERAARRLRERRGEAR